MQYPDEKIGCHHTGFKKDCRTLVTSGRCNRWMQVLGHDPRDGSVINRYDCVDNWGPVLMIENTQMARHTGASVDKVATEVRQFHNGMREMNGHDPLPWENGPAMIGRS